MNACLRSLRLLVTFLACTALGAGMLLAQEPPPLRIMPLGDSITYGRSVPLTFSGYRDLLHALLGDAGYTIDFVGTQIDTENAAIPDPHHEGHRGFRIDEIAAGAPGWLSRIDDPDIILLMIGTNDFLQGYQTSQAPARLNALITQLTAARPFAKVIVASIVPNTQSAAVEAAQVSYNAQIPGLVSAQASLGRDVHFVDMHAALETADISSDGIHPTETGYDKLANAWFDAVTPLIGPYGDGDAPALVHVRPVTAQQVAVTFSKPVEDLAADPAFFTFDSGVPVTAVTLDGTTKRTATLTTGTLAPDLSQTLRITGVRDRTPAHHPIAAGANASFLTPYLANGGFEFGFTGWTVSGSAQLLADAEKYMREGRRVVAFNGGNASPSGVVTQTFATTAGQAYRVLLSAGVVAFNTAEQRLQVMVQGATPRLTQVVAVSGQGGGKVIWAAREFSFVADSASTSLTLRDVSTTSNSIDLLLDDVRVIALQTHALTIASMPDAGAGMVVSPVDTGGSGNGVTPLVRHYLNGSTVTVTAPVNHAGKSFQKWQRNGQDYDTHPATAVTLAGATQLTAVYVAGAPVISSDPQDLTATTGDNAIFAVSASASGTIAYQWRHNGQPIAGATAATLTVPAVDGADAGLYDVLVTSGDESLTSNAAELTVISGGLISNGSFESGFSGWIATGNVITFEGSKPVPNDGQELVVFNGSNATPNGNVKQRFTTTPGQTYSVSLSMGVYSWNTQTQRLRVDLNGNGPLLTQTLSLAGLSNGSTRWSPFSFNFVADSPVTTLAFTDVSTTTGSIDLLLDKVSVVAQGATRTLTLQSSPVSGVSLAVAPADTSGANGGLSPFALSYPEGTVVTVSAPASVTGFTFSKWQLDGSDAGTSPDVVLTLSANRTLMAVYTPAAATLINGSFESEFSGWTQSGNAVIASGAPYQPSDGARLVAFNTGNSTPNGELTQTFTTTPGATYLLRFDYGVRAFNKNSVRIQASVTGSAALASEVYTVAGLGNGTTRWVARSLSFTADSANTTVVFKDVSTTTDAIDLLLDNVRITLP